MEVLVTESNRGAARSAAEQLVAAGHRVHRCHDESSAAFPCVGVTSRCPLDETSVDLVLAVRNHVRPNPIASEAGVSCGLRHRVPVAVAGQTALNPFEAFGAEPVAGDLVDECERIASSARPAHENVARTVVEQSLVQQGQPIATASVSVRRRSGRLRVRVAVPADVSKRARDMIGVRVVGALREFDRHAGGIDIDVVTEASAGGRTTSRRPGGLSAPLPDAAARG